MSILIHNAMILTPDATKEWIDKGFVWIKGHFIEDFGQGEPPKAYFEQADEIIDASFKLVAPALINAHTHAAMSLMRGLADDLPLNKWLQDYIFPVERTMVNEDFVYWGTLLSLWEMISSGTSCIADGYFCEDGAVKACIQAGIRGILAQGVIDYPAPGVDDPSGNIKVAKGFLDKWQGRSDLIQPAVFAHSPYTCSDKTLRQAKELAEAYETFFFIHVAETKWEVDQIKEKQGLTPVGYLNRLGILNDKTVLVHANWLSDEDIKMIKDSGAVVVHNPESNCKLASGLCPVPRLLSEGIKVCLGTDGAASNNNQDLIQEMGFAAKIHKGVTLEPTVMLAVDTLKMATSMAAEAFGIKAGRIEKGYLADLMMVDLKSPHLFPLYAPYSHLVYSAKGSDVVTLMVNGQLIMKDRHYLTLDIEEITKRTLQLSQKIKQHWPAQRPI